LTISIEKTVNKIPKKKNTLYRINLSWGADWETIPAIDIQNIRTKGLAIFK